MAETNKKSTYTLNTEPRLEPILVSLSKDNYRSFINILSSGIKEYDPQVVTILDKYTWLIEQQLQGNVPSLEILKTEFPSLIFDNVAKIESADELSDYIHIYISQKKNRFTSTQFLLAADKIRSQGLTEEDTMKIYKLISSVETSDGYESIATNFRELYEKQQRLEGISFLCSDLDDRTGGITPGQVCTILGAPGSMKTTYSSNIAYNAMKQGKNILYLSLEEPAIQLYSKWLSRCSIDTNTPIPQQDINLHKLDEKQQDALYNKVMPTMNGYPGKIYIVDEQQLSDRSVVTLETKFKEIDKLAREETGHGIDLLVVDHIQLFKFDLGVRIDTITTINMYVSFLRQQALSWLHEKRQIAVILLSQANREGYEYARKNDGAYLSQHVAEASEVERASAYIISVYTNSETQISNQLTLCAVKLRGAALPPSVIPVYEDGAYYLVGNTTDPLGGTIRQVDESQTTLEDMNVFLG